MPYRKMNQFFRPAGIEEYAHFNVHPGKDIIKIEPFNGNISDIDFLCRSTVIPFGIYLPRSLRDRSNIGDMGYVEHIGNDTYIMSKNFDGDPTEVSFPRCQSFDLKAAPDLSFYEEASQSTPIPLTDAHGNVRIPVSLQKKLHAPLTDACIISLFHEAGARWAEVRPDNASIAVNNERAYANAVYGSISGLTYRVALSQKCIGTRYIQTGTILHAPLFGWYSETRKAIIIEQAPEYCAVCDASIRWTQQGHVHKIASSVNIKYLGEGHEIHTLVKAEQTLKKAQTIIDELKSIK